MQSFDALSFPKHSCLPVSDVSFLLVINWSCWWWWNLFNARSVCIVAHTLSCRNTSLGSSKMFTHCWCTNGLALGIGRHGKSGRRPFSVLWLLFQVDYHLRNLNITFISFWLQHWFVLVVWRVCNHSCHLNRTACCFLVMILLFLFFTLQDFQIDLWIFLGRFDLLEINLNWLFVDLIGNHFSLGLFDYLKCWLNVIL